MKQNTIKHLFLGWDRLALPEAVNQIVALYRQPGTLDLGRVIVVVPGQRAGRRLTELLAFFAEDEGLLFTPPEVVTEGKLPEKLYTPKFPFANDLVQDLTWSKALRQLPEEERLHLVPNPPGHLDSLGWLELGKMLRNLHRELAADGLDFESVLNGARNLAAFAETKRWQALVALQRRYHDMLDRQQLWDRQSARLKAIEFHEIKTECDIILFGVVDLNNSLRQMLDQISQRVTAFIVAPSDFADRFDAYGCLNPDIWCEEPVPLRDEQLMQVDGPFEQAEAVTQWLANFDERFRCDEVAIGVPDESLVPGLQRQLDLCGVRGRWVEGVRLGESAPVRLLAAALKFADRNRYEDLAALVRHPDVEDWLRRELKEQRPFGISLPAQLDAFYNASLPSVVKADSLPPNNDDWPSLPAALNRIETWLNEAQSKHPLHEWAGVIRRILDAVYGSRSLDLESPADETSYRTIRKILDVLCELESIPEDLDITAMTSEDVFAVALGPLAKEWLPSPADPNAVELLGWLELPLDDSPALVVTSFNEGFVPHSTGADPFLPDRLRRQLGLLHNERRYARDAYATTVLCHSRREMRFLFARHNANGEPVQPSRLLFACLDDVLVRRARKFFAEEKSLTAPRRLLLSPENAVLEESLFAVPKPVPTEKKTQRISVTRFKSYLACPYRYYLRHVQKLEAVNDAATELDGGTFGSLIHSVLGAFGRDPSGPRENEGEEEIIAFLADELSKQADQIYGSGRRRAAIRLQLEQARQRLRAFASRQAELARAGWHILFAEDNDEELLAADFPVNGESIELVGRIDRIDFNEGEKSIRIIDYKTADTARKPEQTHRKNKNWIDLQLPLYRHLWPAAKQRLLDNVSVPEDCGIQLGYFNLPKKLDDTGVAQANWNETALDDADGTARQVIRDIRAGKFWAPIYPPPDYSQDLAAICLDNLQSAPALDDGAEGVPV